MEIHSSVKFSRAVAPAAAVADNTPFVSQILDCANFQDNELVILAGALADADATFTLLLEESAASDLSGANAVADSDLIGTEALASFVFSDDNAVKKLGYKGSKRYVRATLTPANNSGNAFIAMLWAQSGARKAPLA